MPEGRFVWFQTQRLYTLNLFSVEWYRPIPNHLNAERKLTWSILPLSVAVITLSNFDLIENVFGLCSHIFTHCQNDLGSVLTHWAFCRIKLLWNFLRSCSHLKFVFNSLSSGFPHRSRSLHSFLYLLLRMFFKSENGFDSFSFQNHLYNLHTEFISARIGFFQSYLSLKIISLVKDDFW